ncbi:MAG: hypothetical protein K0R90_1632 [Oscillospiraceae bacterium]|jgi:hypothetical protein|nr:hypothetical protein [Oscillospiraceae bacterium]
MERLTKQLSDGTYALAQDHNTEEMIQKLAKYEDLLEALCMEQSKIVADIEKLRESNKTKTVTYHQLLANKLMIMNLIGRFEIYGL